MKFGIKLKTAAYQIKRKVKVRAEYKKEFSQRIKKVKEQSEKSHCGIGVIGPAAYILKMGDAKIAVDPSLWNIEIQDSVRDEYIELLKTCDAVVVSHGDCDHFDAGVLDDIGGKVPLYIPDFMDYRGEGVIPVSSGDTKTVGNCRLTFFESAHTGDRVVPEYGFAVSLDGKNYVFPVDVRDYEKEHPVFENTEVLVAHLWLGKENALNLCDNPYIDLFADFVNSFCARKVLLGHLLDARRTIKDMWSEIHYEAIKNKVCEGRILRLGDFIEL